MKAKELLKRYAEGERNFQNVNIQSESFKGKDLSGSDFSGANIKGSNFTEANLTDAKFVGTQAGMPTEWTLFLLTACLFFLWVSLFLANLLLGYITSFVMSAEIGLAITGWIGLFCLLAFSFLFTYQEIDGLAVVVAIIMVGFAFAGVGAIVVGFASAGVVASAGTFTVAGVRAVALVVGAVALAFAGVALALAVGAVALAAAGVAVAFVGATSGAVAVVGLVLPVVIGAFSCTFAFAFARSVAGVAGPIMFLYTSVCLYLGLRAIQGDLRYEWIRMIAVLLAAIGGTNFCKANLTDADFTKANLKDTNFRDTILIRTCFKETRKLNLARSGDTYLKRQEVQELISTGQGQNRKFESLNLQGINLQEANLIDASFRGCNLSYANLKNANLSRVNLVQTQLEGTDFTGAILTGAYIQDWGIARDTKFDEVKCEYVYMRLPTKENPDPFRKPDNNKEVFADGEFSDFIKPILDTLDLYHTQDIDPRAIAIALNRLVENNPDAKLEIRAMEKRGNNLLIRLATSPIAARPQLSAEYFNDYNEIKLLNERYKGQLLEKDDRIRSLENMLLPLLYRPTLYAQTYYQKGDIMSDKSSNFKFDNVGGDVAGIAGGDISGVAGKDITGAAGGDISGTVTASIGQLARSESPDAPKLADWLKQLHSAIEADTNLSEKEKAKALKQVQLLVEAGKDPKDEEKKDLASDAITMLKGLIGGLPGLAASVKAVQELLPLITTFFGL